MKKLILTSLLAVASTANALELSLKSDDNAVVWDSTTPLWIPKGGGTLQAWQTCDMAYIGTDFTGSKVTIGAYVHPKELRIENSQELTINDSATSGHGLAYDVQIINKYGSGTLIADFSAWRNYQTCDWHVYGGMLRTGKSGGSDNFRIGNVEEHFTIYLHDGASFWQPCHNFIAYRSDGANKDGKLYEDMAPSIHVYTNATLHVGNMDKTIDNDWTFLTVMDIILDGGTLDLTRRGSWGDGYLKVNRKMEFKGKTPYVLNMDGMDARLELPKSRLLEFAVDDITGDDSSDVTLKGFYMGPKASAGVASYSAGFKKTGKGTLQVNQKLFLTTECPGGNYGSGSRGLFGIDGVIRVEDGTLYLNNGANSITGKIEVAGGLLKFDGNCAWTDRTKSALGSFIAPREIEISNGGVLLVGRNALGTSCPYDGLTVTDKTWIVVREGGTLRGGDTGCYGNVWLDGGTMEYTGDGEWPHGYGGVLGTWKFTGNHAYVFDVDKSAGKTENCQQFHLNNNSQTTFDVADITGDALPDVTFKVGLARNAHSSGSQWIKAPNVGFRKIGTGTMRCDFNTAVYGAGGVAVPDGTVAVEAGTLDVVNGLSEASLAVSSNAFVSGTGKVKNATFAAGAGVRQAVQSAKALEVSGTTTIAGEGVVDLVADTVPAKGGLKTVAAKFTGTVTGADNLQNWKVTINGQEVFGRVFLDSNKQLVAKRQVGAVILFK